MSGAIAAPPVSPVTGRFYPELTWTAVIVGWILGVIIAISIGYAALILGFSIEGSELAAILGFGILRGVLRRKSIIENNIVQTIASGVNGASSGMMFSVPAIFILGYGDQFDPVIMTFGCIAGAFLGIAFIIPLRKHMIDFERLTYPGGVAVATILKSPGAGLQMYANLMRNFAAGERYINRVWSASADGYDAEARTYLGKAAPQFRDAQAQLQAATA